MTADILNVANQSTANAASIGLDFTIPADKVLILLAFTFSATRGGVVTVSNINIGANRADTSGSTRLYFRNQAAGTIEAQDDRQGEWWFGPSTRLQAIAGFSGADAGNTFRFDFWAIQIPRGQLGYIVTER